MFFCEFLIARAHWGPSGPIGAHDRAPLKESSHEQHIQTHLYFIMTMLITFVVQCAQVKLPSPTKRATNNYERRT